MLSQLKSGEDGHSRLQNVFYTSATSLSYWLGLKGDGIRTGTMTISASEALDPQYTHPHTTVCTDMSEACNLTFASSRYEASLPRGLFSRHVSLHHFNIPEHQCTTVKEGL